MAEGTTETAPVETTVSTASPSEPVAAAPTETAPSIALVAETKPAETAAPAELELKLPEGFKADDPTLVEFRGIAKELGLDSAKAQKVFDLWPKMEAAREKAFNESREQTLKGWSEALKTDKEVGGAEHAKHLADAKFAVDKFGKDPELQAFFKSGWGNFPPLVRMMARVGKSLAEDTVAGTAAAADQGSEQLEHLKKLYPNSPGLFPQSS